MSKPSTHPAPASSSWIDVVPRQVERIRFGSVQIIVHEGRVTQVESVDETRLAGGSAGRETASDAAPKNPATSGQNTAYRTGGGFLNTFAKAHRTTGCGRSANASMKSNSQHTAPLLMALITTLSAAFFGFPFSHMIESITS